MSRWATMGMALLGLAALATMVGFGGVAAAAESHSRSYRRCLMGETDKDLDFLKQYELPACNAEIKRKNPADLPALYSARGHARFVLGDHEGAVSDYSESIKVAIDPVDRSDRYFRRAKMYTEWEKIDLAIADYTSAIALDPKGSAQYWQRGLLYVQLGRLQDAVADFNTGLSHSPRAYQLVSARAKAYRDLGEFDRALADFEELIRQSPDEFGYFGRGQTYEKMGDLAHALADYHAVAAMTGLESLDESVAVQEQARVRIAALESLLATTPAAKVTAPPPTPTVEASTEQSGSVGETVEDDRTLECDTLTADFDPDLPSGITRVWSRDIDVERAIPACQAAAEAHPRERRLLFEYGRALEAAKRLDEAMKYYRDAAALGSGPAMNNIGLLYQAGLGVPKDARQALRWFEASVARGSPRAAYSLGHLYMDGQLVASDDDRAATYFVRSLKTGPELVLEDFYDRLPFTPGVLRQIQQFLHDEGVYTDAADGQLSSATIKSVEAYKAKVAD